MENGNIPFLRQEHDETIKPKIFNRLDYLGGRRKAHFQQGWWFPNWIVPWRPVGREIEGIKGKTLPSGFIVSEFPLVGGFPNLISGGS